MLAPESFQRCWVLAIAGVLACCAAGTSYAQNAPPPDGKAPKTTDKTTTKATPKGPAKPYTEIAFTDPQEWKSLRAPLIEKGKSETADELKVFTNHYKAVIAKLTQYSGEVPSTNIAERGDRISDIRTSLKSDLVMLAKRPSAELHDALVDQLFKMLPILFNSDKYHPVTRVNALWLYGDLNSKEGDSPIVPLATTFPVLLKLFTTDTQHAYLRMTALGGLARQSEAGLPPEARKELAAEMLKVLKASPPGLKPEVYDFVRLRAVEIVRNLAAKNSEANTKAIAGALYALAQDKNRNTPLDLRCEALRAMGSLDSKLIEDQYVAKFAQTYAALAVEITRQAAPAAEADGEAPVADARVRAPMPAIAPAQRQVVAFSQDPDEQNPTGQTPPAAVPDAAAAVEVAEETAPEKPHGALTPDVQTYLLGCVAIGLSGAQTDSKRGLINSASDKNNKKLIVDVTTKLNDVLKVIKFKKKGDALSPDELKKIQNAANELELLAGARPNVATRE